MSDRRVPDPQDPFAATDMQAEHTGSSKAILRWIVAGAVITVILAAIALAVTNAR
jgi:hypothetical protein